MFLLVKQTKNKNFIYFFFYFFLLVLVFTSSTIVTYLNHGFLPERQSHGHGVSYFFRSALTCERLRENRREQTCLLNFATEVE